MTLTRFSSLPPPRSVHQHARVWLPDAEEVWKSAELIKDYTPGDLTLTVQLEDGTVRQANATHTHTHIDTHRKVEALRWKWVCDVLSESHEHISLQEHWRWSLHKSLCAVGLLEAAVMFGKRT